MCKADNIPVMQYFNPEKSIGFLIYEVSRLMRRDFDTRVQTIGLTTAQWRALAHIASREGCRQSTTAEILEIKPITLTRLIDRLEEAGWVERKPDAHDRRAVQLHLTEQARPLLKTMQEKSAQTRARALEGITDEEVTVLFDTLKRMKANLAD